MFDSNYPPDHWLVYSAYLSELWAAFDLAEKAQIFNLPFLKAQIEDEARHAEVLRDALVAEGFKLPKCDLSYAMQENIHRDILMIDLKATGRSLDAFRGIHEINEMRAIGIYRTYLRGGTIQRFKDVMKVIIEDEKSHVHHFRTDHPAVAHAASMDKWFFTKWVPRHYGRNLLDPACPFWADYFGKRLTIQGQYA